MTGWWEFPVDVYLDQRHRNWLLAEELGDVRFVPSAEVVLVHRERAEHIAEVLFGGRDVVLLERVLALPAKPPFEPPRPPASSDGGHTRGVPPAAIISKGARRWRHALGWLGIAGAAAGFVAALAVPLDDPALVVAWMLGLRSSRLIADVES